MLSSDLELLSQRTQVIQLKRYVFLCEESCPHNSEWPGHLSLPLTWGDVLGTVVPTYNLSSSEG